MTTATNGSREPFVSIRNLTKRFGDLVAVDDVSLAVGEGHTLALLGPSGCGKTTILRCIAGLETPDAGPISIAGRVAFDGAQGIDLKPEQRELGVVFQSYAVWPHMTVEQNVGFPLKVRKVAKDEQRDRVARILEVVGLPHGTTSRRRNCPAASSSASRWPARWFTSRVSSCSTSRCRTSTRNCATRCESS